MKRHLCLSSLFLLTGIHILYFGFSFHTVTWTSNGNCSYKALPLLKVRNLWGVTTITHQAAFRIRKSHLYHSIDPSKLAMHTSFLYQLLTALDKPSQWQVLSLPTTLKSSLDPPLISCACTNQCSNKATFNTQQKGYRRTKAQGFVYVYIIVFPFNIHPSQMLGSLKRKKIKKNRKEKYKKACCSYIYCVSHWANPEK